jgi:hypothetical protein
LVCAPGVGARHRRNQVHLAEHGQPGGDSQPANLWRHLVDPDPEQFLRLWARRCLGRRQRRGDTNSNTCGNRDANTHPKSCGHRNANTGWNRDAYPNAGGNANACRNAYPDTRRNSDSDPQRNSDSDPQRYSDTDPKHDADGAVSQHLDSDASGQWR